MTETRRRPHEPAASTGDQDRQPRDDEWTRPRSRIAELEERWRRALADLDNLRKRAARDAAPQQARERARVAAEWLPVIDNLDLALEHAAADPEPIVDGGAGGARAGPLRARRAGLPPARRCRRAFDPFCHEAVATQPDTDAAPGTILQVIRPGYGGADRPLTGRPGGALDPRVVVLPLLPALLLLLVLGKGRARLDLLLERLLHGLALRALLFSFLLVEHVSRQDIAASKGWSRERRSDTLPCSVSSDTQKLIEEGARRFLEEIPALKQLRFGHTTRPACAP